MRLAKSFYNALLGIYYCVKHERNMKIHLCCALAVCLAGCYFQLSKIEWLILSLTIALVIALEIVNTAIERVIDLLSPTFHPLAKVAKNSAAGAVLVMALASLVVGYLLFWDKIMR